MSWKVTYSTQAECDLQEIYQYIAFKLMEPYTAQKMLKKLFAVIRSLDEMPMRHPIYDAEPLKSQGVRTVAVEKYLIFYLPNEADHTVMISRIIFGGRDLTKQDISLHESGNGKEDMREQAINSLMTELQKGEQSAANQEDWISEEAILAEDY